jgi:hypothetical protein
MSRKINGYYSISIITLVIMGFIFIRGLYVNDWFAKNASPSYLLQQEYAGQYTFLEGDTLPKFTSVPLDSTADDGWWDIRRDDQAFLRLRLSDFEDDQILVELFDVDSLGGAVRRDACELLLRKAADGSYRGHTLGELCGFDPELQTFQYLKINLAKPYLSVDIETIRIEDDRMVTKSVYVLKKEKKQ